MNTDTRAFLLHLWRGGVWGTYFTLPKKITYWQRASDPGNLPKDGTHIYFSVHPVNERPSGQGRTTNALVSAVNCLYADVDGKHYEGKPAALAHVLQIDPPPTVIIDSGGGWHVYWLLVDPYPVTDDNRAQIRHLQDRWVAYTGGDPSSKDLAHILRPPGTVNSKYDPPRPVSIYQNNWTRLYTLDELAAVLPAEPVRSASATMAHATTGGADLDRVRSALQRLAPWRCDQHQAWIEVGMSLQELGTDGLALWDNWSAGCPDKYKPGECEKRWRSFDQDGRGLGSLYYWADQDSPRPINGSTPMTTTATNPTVDDRTPSIGAASSTEPEFPDELPPEEIEKQEAAPVSRFRRWTVAELYDEDFPEPRWAVPGIIPEGLTILSGRPKVGKSWMALQIAWAVATGGILFDHRVDPGNVLYLGLEDSPRRLKKRLQAMGVSRDAGINFQTQWQPLHKGGLEALTLEIDVTDYRLVIIDTIERACPGVDKSDESAIGPIFDRLQRLAQTHNMAILVNDHLRKPSGYNSDPIDDTIGSTAKTGTADTILALYKQHGMAGARMLGRGRETEEIDLKLFWDPLTSCWQCEGNATEIAMTERRNEILDALRELGKTQAPAVARYTGKDRSNTTKQLNDLANSGLAYRETIGGKVYYWTKEDDN